MSENTEKLMETRDLSVQFAAPQGMVQAVRGVSLAVDPGECLALVGESGCGKSVTAKALMGLLDEEATVTPWDSVAFRGQPVYAFTQKQWSAYRGAQVSMIFQDPMVSLNPTLRVGRQIAEMLQFHENLPKKQAWDATLALLTNVGIGDAAVRARWYPHQFSGGMRQRAMIAMTIACKPALLIADEPTTALDVTTQDNILRLLRRLQQENGMAMLLISHDLNVVASAAHRVAVMYAGKIVETGPVKDVYAAPRHPYTRALLASAPGQTEGTGGRMRAIEGMPPNLLHPPEGCAFAARCPHNMRVCGKRQPENFTFDNGRQAACWLCHPAAPAKSGATT
jgi:oligopeptide/dipeptide ABC transporter ATP-binding protein